MIVLDRERLPGGYGEADAPGQHLQQPDQPPEFHVIRSPTADLRAIVVGPQSRTNASDRNQPLRTAFESFVLVYEAARYRYIDRRWISDLPAVDTGERGENMRFAFFRSDDVLDLNASNQECVADQRSMTTPGNSLGAHQDTALGAGELRNPFNVLVELWRLHVIRIASKREIAPAQIG